MRIMTLDGGGTFGWAHGDPKDIDVPPVSGSQGLPSIQTTKMMISLENWLMGMIKANGITDLYIEKSIIPKMTSYDSVVKLAGYNIVSGIAATKCGIRAVLVDMQSWRSELGLPTQGPKNVLQDPIYAAKFKGRKDALKVAKRAWVKDRARDFAIAKGSDPKDDNESDAICIYHAMVQRIQAREDKVKFDLFAELTV